MREGLANADGLVPSVCAVLPEPCSISPIHLGVSKRSPMSAERFRFDPVDHEFMRLRGQLSPGARLQAMLAAREWVVAAMRLRLRQRYPGLSPQEINLKVLEEIENVELAT